MTEPKTAEDILEELDQYITRDGEWDTREEARAVLLAYARWILEQSAVVLDGWRKAYPEDLWPPLTDTDLRSGGTLIDRAGAAMGRHVSIEAAKQIRALLVEIS